MASDNPMGRDRELVLTPNTFAFVLDSTKGKVAVYVGPKKDSLSSTDQLVEWDEMRQRFVAVNDVERAIQVFAMAGEGQYIVLSNPSGGDAGKHPSKAAVSEAIELDVGRKVNVPGPATFPLWPGQAACAIDGHHLRHNQYLMVRVYDEEKARENWKSAVVKPQMAKVPVAPVSKEEGSEQLKTDDIDPKSSLSFVTEVLADSLTIGQLMVVKGTEVSFYIPPTGIEVVPEDGGNFVREAVTLERLEYCVLLDENGEKSYMQGPKVVFPKPTEKFIEDNGNRKFLGIELNEQSGIYVKVIDEYTEGDHEYEVGEELFITGKEQAIYFPRPEHCIVEYGKKRVHYAIAIPEGEGRYVLNRKTGAVDLKKGPAMFLPDPRTQVVVRRILDPHTVELLYPGNKEAASVNARYKEMSAELPVGNYLASGESSKGLLASQAVTRGASEQFGGDSFSRTSSFTPPRTIVLDTKYEGAVAVNIWPGYAVMVVEKTGERRVEVGPKMILLDYGETLMPLELSTGKPKTDKTLFRTAYLRVTNNQVSDVVTVETKDLVKVNVKISYRVNFEGDGKVKQESWFSVENYVKVLTDHCRSRICNFAKRHGIQEFYSNTIDIVREAILGETPKEGKRPGLAFNENGMRVYDVEVLDVSMEESDVAGLLVDAQAKALSGAIQLSAAEEEAKRKAKLEELKRQSLDEAEKTAVREAELALKAVARNLAKDKEQASASAAVASVRREEEVRVMQAARKIVEQEVELARLRSDQELEHLQGLTNEMLEKTKVLTPDMIAALQMFGDQQFVERVTQALGPLALATGVTTADLLGQVFKGTPFEGVMQNLANRPLANKSE